MTQLKTTIALKHADNVATAVAARYYKSNPSVVSFEDLKQEAWLTIVDIDHRGGFNATKGVEFRYYAFQGCVRMLQRMMWSNSSPVSGVHASKSDARDYACKGLAFDDIADPSKVRMASTSKRFYVSFSEETSTLPSQEEDYHSNQIRAALIDAAMRASIPIVAVSVLLGEASIEEASNALGCTPKQMEGHAKYLQSILKFDPTLWRLWKE
jgi:hypothetical protein